jgi:hypothetical protein
MLDYNIGSEEKWFFPSCLASTIEFDCLWRIFLYNANFKFSTTSMHIMLDTFVLKLRNRDECSILKFTLQWRGVQKNSIIQTILRFFKNFHNWYGGGGKLNKNLKAPWKIQDFLFASIEARFKTWNCFGTSLPSPRPILIFPLQYFWRNSLKT